jgi:hypothetical protein
MISKDLRKLTQGEKLWLWRRSHAWGGGSRGLTQFQAAVCWKMPVKRYWECETDRVTWVGGKFSCSPKVGDLCALARRRSGLTLRKVARLLHISHVTVLAWEKYNEIKLVQGWKRMGWRFP